MTFHPDTLDANTLRRLAKNLKQRAATVLPSPLKLSQAQELLAGAMGHPDWHAALKRATSSAVKEVPKENSDTHRNVLHDVFLRADFFEHMDFMVQASVGEYDALKSLASMYEKQGGKYESVAAYINAFVLPLFNRSDLREVPSLLSAELKRFSAEEAMAWTLGQRFTPVDRWKLGAERARRSKEEYLQRNNALARSAQEMGGLKW